MAAKKKRWNSGGKPRIHRLINAAIPGVDAKAGWMMILFERRPALLWLMTITNTEILDQLKLVSDGLLMMSESEYPLEAFLWDVIAPATSEKFYNKPIILKTHLLKW